MESRRQLEMSLEEMAVGQALLTTDAPYLFNTAALDHYTEIYALHLGNSACNGPLQSLVHSLLLEQQSITVSLSKIHSARTDQTLLLEQIEIPINYADSFDDLDQQINMAMARLADCLGSLPRNKTDEPMPTCSRTVVFPSPPEAIMNRLKQSTSLEAFLTWYERWGPSAFGEFERKLKQSA